MDDTTEAVVGNEATAAMGKEAGEELAEAAEVAEEDGAEGKEGAAEEGGDGNGMGSRFHSHGSLTGNWQEEEELLRLTGYRSAPPPMTKAFYNTGSRVLGEGKWDPENAAVMRSTYRNPAHEESYKVRPTVGPREQLRLMQLRQQVEEEMAAKEQKEEEDRRRVLYQSVTAASFGQIDPQAAVNASSRIASRMRKDGEEEESKTVAELHAETVAQLPAGSYVDAQPVTFYSHAISKGMSLGTTTGTDNAKNPFARSATTSEVKY